MTSRKNHHFLFRLLLLLMSLFSQWSNFQSRYFFGGTFCLLCASLDQKQLDSFQEFCCFWLQYWFGCKNFLSSCVLTFTLNLCHMRAIFKGFLVVYVARLDKFNDWGIKLGLILCLMTLWSSSPNFWLRF